MNVYTVIGRQMTENKHTIEVMSHFAFDQKMRDLAIFDENVEYMQNLAFISIIGTPQVLSDYLEEPLTEHWFKRNHPNVLNLDFDDVGHDLQFVNCEFKAMSPKQAKETVEFIERNLGKDFIIHCRAGVSRSQAIGCFIYDFYKEHFYEEQPYLKRDFANKGVFMALKKVLYERDAEEAFEQQLDNKEITKF